MRRWLREYSLANFATIYQGTYRFQQAIQAWDKLLTSFPKSRYVPTALVQSGNAALDMNNPEEAKKRFQRLAGLAGLAEGEKVKARYYLIRITQKQGEASKNTTLIGQALDEYKKLLAEVEKNAEMKEVAALAKLGIGECLIGLSKFGEALTYFQGIADTTEDPLMLAGVFNGLGLCYFRTEKWKEAMLAFLRVEVLYNSDPNATAMALFYSGKCFEFMTGANIGQDNPTRARAQYRKCIQKYGGTSWGKMASEALPNVRGK
jgi:tetratricopeptide (TPR) repeat protein